MNEIEDLDTRQLEIERLKGHLRLIAAMCGHIDAAQGCRLILQEVKEALN